MNKKLMFLYIPSVLLVIFYVALHTQTVQASVSAPAQAEDIIRGCKNTPVQLSISSSDNTAFTFTCSDSCHFTSKFTGYSSIQIGGFAFYSQGYEFVFPTAGEHTISAFKNGSFSTQTKIVIAESHAFGDPEITQEVTCTSDGIKKYTCPNCKHSYTETLPALGHKYSKTSELQPTCTKDGFKIYLCSNCGEYREDKLPSNGHSYSSWTVLKKADIFRSGSKRHICTKYGSIETQTIEKLPANVSLTKDKLYLKVGRQSRLKIKNKTRGDKILSWESSKKNIVFINKKTGKIKARKSGTAIVTLKMKSGCSAKCRVIAYDQKISAAQTNPNLPYIIRNY